MTSVRYNTNLSTYHRPEWVDGVDKARRRLVKQPVDPSTNRPMDATLEGLATRIRMQRVTKAIDDAGGGKMIRPENPYTGVRRFTEWVVYVNGVQYGRSRFTLRENAVELANRVNGLVGAV
jgi:hypothetical protein